MQLSDQPVSLANDLTDSPIIEKKRDRKFGGHSSMVGYRDDMDHVISQRRVTQLVSVDWCLLIPTERAQALFNVFFFLPQAASLASRWSSSDGHVPCCHGLCPSWLNEKDSWRELQLRCLPECLAHLSAGKSQNKYTMMFFILCRCVKVALSHRR